MKNILFQKLYWFHCLHKFVPYISNIWQILSLEFQKFFSITRTIFSQSRSGPILETNHYSFYTLSVDKNRHFLTPSPPCRDDIVYGRPLTRSSHNFSLEFQKFFSITRTFFSQRRTKQFWEQWYFVTEIVLTYCEKKLF